MKCYPQAQIMSGDALSTLRTLDDESVQMVCTSPPYYGLRDYDVAGQIGLEATPAEYIDKMVAVFRQVRRVLRKDGVAWVNMGDSYASGGRASYRSGASDNKGHTVQNEQPRPVDPPGIKPKDLMGMPWRLAFALQADGWYLRQDIIWHKPNPMPESVTDRCTKAHEYVFLLSKSEHYYYNADAVSEPASESTHARLAQNVAAQIGSDRAHGGGKTNGPMRAMTPGRKLDMQANDSAYGCGKSERMGRGAGWRTRKLAEANSGIKNNESFNAAMALMTERRNRRSVWTMVTEGYGEAHFATFPTELPRICILAGSKTGDTILDPFNGSGTTGQVALELGRQYIGIELNPAYVALTNKRLKSVTFGLPLEAAA